MAKIKSCECCGHPSARWATWYIYIDGERIKCDGRLCIPCSLDRME